MEASLNVAQFALEAIQRTGMRYAGVQPNPECTNLAAMVQDSMCSPD